MRGLKQVVIAVVISICFQGVFAQEGVSGKVVKEEYSDADLFNDASLLMEDKLYIQALEIWQKLYKKDTANSNFAYRIGVCLLNSSGHKPEGLPYFEKSSMDISQNWNALDPNEKKAPMDAIYYLGKSYHLNYELDKAVSAFERFRKIAGKKHFLIPEIDHQLQMVANAKELMKDSVELVISNLGDQINGLGPEFGPVITLDEEAIYFTSRRLRKDSTNFSYKDIADGMHFEDIYVSYKDQNGFWKEPEVLNINRASTHDATIGLSGDGQTLYIYRDDDGDGNLYQSELVGDQWSTPFKLGSDINMSSFESHLTVSADNKTLYFISDRKGSIGKKDIYRCLKLPNGQWSKALNIGDQINTKYDEDGVYLHPDGKTLYFSSTGHKSMGGYDIFETVLGDDGNWSTPRNLGYPINTTDDDIFYILSADGKRAYYSSVRLNDTYGEKDIYMIERDDAEEKELTLIKGRLDVPEGQELPEDLMIIVTDNETGKLVHQGKPLKRNGSFVFIMPPGKNYNISYEAEGIEFYNENIFVPTGSTYNEIDKAITLNPLKLGAGDGAVVVKENLPLKIPKWQLQFSELSHKVPPGMQIHYMDVAGHVIYEETVDAKGFFKYHELPANQSYMFKIANADNVECEEAEITLVNADDGKTYKLIGSKDCTFRMEEVGQKTWHVRYVKLDSDLPEDLTVEYYDDNGKLIKTETVGKGGYFSYHDLPNENFSIKLISAEPICDKVELDLIQGNTVEIIMLESSDCKFSKSKIWKMDLDKLGSDKPSDLTVQFFDDNGKLLFETSPNDNGYFGYDLLSSDKVNMKILGADNTVLNNGYNFMLLDGDKPSMMVAQLKDSKFEMFNVWKMNLEKLAMDNPQNLKVQFFDDKGNLVYETSPDRNGYLGYKYLKSDKFSIKVLDANNTVLNKGFEFTVLKGDNPSMMIAQADDGKFAKSNFWRLNLKELNRDVPDGIKVQFFDDNGNLVYETSLSSDGTFAYNKLASKASYFKLLDANNTVIENDEFKFDFLENEKVVMNMKQQDDGKLVISNTDKKQDKINKQDKKEDKKEDPPKKGEPKETYHFEFGYNQTEVSKTDGNYVKFMKKVSNIIEKDGSVNIKIESSASKVPTKTYGSNSELARVRANQAKKVVMESIKEMGYDESKVKVMDSSTLIQGPSYERDRSNLSKYKKYQYIKIEVY